MSPSQPGSSAPGPNRPASSAPNASHRRGAPNAAPRVGIVCATGAVGAELLLCLEQRAFPLSGLRLFASSRSAGRTLRFRDAAIAVEERKRGLDLPPEWVVRFRLNKASAGCREHRCRSEHGEHSRGNTGPEQ